MLKNYVVTAWRNLWRYKGHSLLTVAGLAVGLACALLILLYVHYERSYDRFHANHERIHRVALNAKFGDTRLAQTHTPAILTRTLYEEYPDVEISLRLKTFDRGLEARQGEKIFNEYRCAAADPEFFRMFSFPLLAGDAAAVLREPYSVVLGSATARRYYGETDPTGRVLTIGGTDYQVTGVMADMPANAHFHFDLLMSIASFDGLDSSEWLACNYRTYIQLRQGVSRTSFEARLAQMVRRHMFREGNYDRWVKQGNYWEFFLQPLADIHLRSHLDGELEPNGHAGYVTAFFIIALFILLLAVVNYVNLVTARAAGRAREVGLRKVAGATRGQLTRQFLAESVWTSLLALLGALVLGQLLLPFFGQMMNRPLAVPGEWWPWLVPALPVLAVIIGLLAGVFPALVLSSFRPATLFHGRLGGAARSATLRHALVLVQFTISIALIAGTLVVQRQLSFLLNKDLGFDREQVIVLRTPAPLGERSAPFKDTLRRHPAIREASGSNTLPGRFFSKSLVRAEGLDQGVTLNISLCEPELPDVLQLEMLQGRFLSREHGTDKTAVVINETAARLLGWEQPIGKTITPGSNIPFHVVGVVRDYHFESLHQTVQPAALALLDGAWNWWPEQFIAIRVQTADMPGTLAFLETTWQRFSQGHPLEYTFLDQDYAALYDNEARTARLFRVFAGLAIFIACLGLFGLASFATAQRAREIGIRKVLGASVPEILFLLTRGFARWVLLANVVAWPAAYLLMNRWLENFAYRIQPDMGIFLMAGLAALGIALLTVSVHTVRTATAPPVKSLRCE
jgi:putative ABC transport system permease protein